MVFLGTGFQNSRGVPFKGRKSLVGCRLKDSSKMGGSKGGRGVGGKVSLPPIKVLITPRRVGE